MIRSSPFRSVPKRNPFQDDHSVPFRREIRSKKSVPFRSVQQSVPQNPFRSVPRMNPFRSVPCCCQPPRSLPPGLAKLFQVGCARPGLICWPDRRGCSALPSPVCHSLTLPAQPGGTRPAQFSWSRCGPLQAGGLENQGKGRFDLTTQPDRASLIELPWPCRASDSGSSSRGPLSSQAGKYGTACPLTQLCSLTPLLSPHLPARSHPSWLHLCANCRFSLCDRSAFLRAMPCLLA